MRYFWTCLITLVVFGKTYSQTEGNVFFGSTSIHEIRFTFHQANYWDSLTDGYINDYYIKGDVEIDGTLMLDCGIKLKGNSSYTVPGIKKSFKIDMNEYVSGQDYDGLKKLNLNNGFKDPTFLREKLMNEFLRDHGCYAPRTHFANMYINNTLWGLYSALDEVDTKTFLTNNIGDDRGNMFKGDPQGNLSWYGTNDSSYYSRYELHTNEITNDWTDLVCFLNTLNNTPVANLQPALDTIFDTQNYIRSWAIHSLFSNLDSYLGSGHNYFIYHDSTDNKFKWVSWDVNEAFGKFTMGMSVTEMENLSIFYISNPQVNRPLHYKMLQVPVYEQALVNAVCEFTLYDFSSPAIDPKIDSLANWIRSSVYADPNKFYSNQNFEDNLAATINIMAPPPNGGNYPGLKSFVANKRLAVTSELVAYGCNVSIEDHDILDVSILPNPASDHIQISGLEENKDYKINIYNMLGSILYSGSLSNSIISLDGINVTGVLLVEIRELNSDKSIVRRIVKN